MSYRVIRPLVSGGFSDVLEVEDTESALVERLVLKRLNAEMSAKEAVREAFAEEAKILRDLRHPNVVTFRRCYLDQRGQICLLMEKVDGEPLDAWASRRGGSPEKVLDLFERVVAAVDYLHHRATPYLHLDLKPDNILVTTRAGVPQPVLIDFGIARRSGMSGLKAYTPPYGAPEQVAGKNLGCATDVYALGQILTEIVAAFEPAEASALGGVLALARQATATDPRKRPPDAGALLLALRRARRAGAIESRPSPGTQIREAWSRIPRRLRLAAAGAALAVGLLVTVLTLSGTAPEESGAEAQSPSTRPVAGVAVETSFTHLVNEARRATYERRFDRAEDLYDEARGILAAAPGEHERAMERELSSLRSQIDIVRYGGREGERTRLDLQ